MSNEVSKEPAASTNDFAAFFKNYAIGLALIVATLPVLVSKLELLPIFSSIKGSLSFITSLISYLLVGFLWSKRQHFSKKLFPYVKVASGLAISKKNFQSMRFWGGWAPGGLIVLTLLSFWAYNALIPAATERVLLDYSSRTLSPVAKSVTADSIENRAITKFGLTRNFDVIVNPVRDTKNPAKILSYEQVVVTENEDTQTAILNNLPSILIPNKFWMYVSFLGIFLFASAAFILMGLKDYLQSRKGISDEAIEEALMLSTARFKIDDYPVVIGSFEYLPDDASYKYRDVDIHSATGSKHSLLARQHIEGEGVEFYYLQYDDKDKVDKAIVVADQKKGDVVDFEKKLRDGAWERFEELHGIKRTDKVYDPAEMKMKELHG